MCCVLVFVVFFFKQKTAYEMRISDWSSDVCSSDLGGGEGAGRRRLLTRPRRDPAFVGATSAASSSEWPATTHLGQKLAAEALPQGRSCLPGLCRSQPLRCPGDKLRS